MTKIYSVKHFLRDGETDPLEYFVSSRNKPEIAQVVKVLKIDFKPSKGESISINSLYVVPINMKREAH